MVQPPFSFWPSFHISIVKSLKVVMSFERENTHTQSKLYTYPKEHNSINMSSLLIKFKIYYKKKKF